MNNQVAREGTAGRGSVDGAGLRRPGGSRKLLAALLTALLLAVGVVVVVPAASAAPGDVGVEGPSHSGTGTPTGTKRSTSGLWFNDGTWWGNLWDTASSDFHIFRFNVATSSWVDTRVATDTRANTHHDVLWDGTTLYVASYRFVNDGLPAEPNYPTTMRRYSYDSVAKTYKLLGSSQINNQRVEALTIDKDSKGRLWATWQQGNRIYLNNTDEGGVNWGTPFAHPASLSNVSVDDTSAVIAFGGNKMGVMWSRQVGDATDGMYWSYHEDSATSRTAWTAPVAAVSGQRSGDDHMNLKWLDSSNDKVFAAIKTSKTASADPLIQLLALDTATAKWTPHTIATVAECPNRVIVMIDESAQKLRTFATYPKPSGTTNAGGCTSSGGAIYEKSTPLDKISFTTTKTARIVDADQYVHNVTSTKQNINNATGTANSGLLLLADVNATSRYWHYYDGTGGGGGGDTTAPTVTGTSPTADATGVAVSANVTGTFSEAMDASTVTSNTFTLRAGTTTVPAAVTYNSTDKVVTLNPDADLVAGTTYTATIKGGTSGVKDVAGNVLASDKTWTFTTASTGGGTTETVTLTVAEDSYVSSGTPTTNFGTASVLGVDGSPTEISYLKFDLGAYAGREITGATLQLRATSSGSSGTQNVKLVSDDSWTETGITYNNKPALGTAVGNLGPTSSNTNYNVTLTAGSLPTDQFLSLGLDSGSGDGLDLGSGETTTPPKLVLTVSGSGGGGGTTPTPTDTTAPETTITSGPPATSTSTSASFAFTSSEANSTFQCSLDGSARVACTSPQAYSGLSVGSHTFNVWATDTAGNTDATAATQTWSVDSGSGTTETVTLTATADSYVSAGATGTNYGTSTLLGVDSSTEEITYLKFELSAYAGRTLQGATLQLRSAGSGSTGTQNVKLAPSDGWTETGITYSNRPALGAVVGTLGPTTTNTNYIIPLTLSGALGQQLALGMDSSSSDGLDLNSKEANGGTYAPKLVLTLSGGGGATAPTTTDTTAPTVTTTSPAGGAAAVAVTANVTGTLSEAMNASTVSSSTFTLTAQGTTTAVPAAVTYAGNVATLDPSADLAASTLYTATIKGGASGVKDVAGNALATDKTWTFTTAAPDSGSGTTETVTLTATADSYVSAGATGTNYGTSTLLGVDNSPVEVAYLKFDLSTYAGRTLQSATLQLRSAGSGSTGRQNVKLAPSDGWTETGITYSNRPTLGAVVGTLGPTTTNTNYIIPLTVSGTLGQQLALGIDSSSSDGLDLNSKEANGGTYAPKLVLTLAK